MNGQNNQSGKSLAAMALVIVLVLTAGAGGLVLGAKVLSARKSHAAGATADARVRGEKASAESAKTAPEATEQGRHESKSEYANQAVVVDLGEFLVNLAGGTENRYLRAEVSIRISGLPAAAKKSRHGAAEDSSLPDGDLAVAKDCVTTVLSSGVFQQLRTSAGRAQLKQDVQSRLDEVLPRYKTHEVLFTSFVMQ